MNNEPKDFLHVSLMSVSGYHLNRPILFFSKFDIGFKHKNYHVILGIAPRSSVYN